MTLRRIDELGKRNMILQDLLRDFVMFSLRGGFSKTQHDPSGFTKEFQDYFVLRPEFVLRRPDFVLRRPDFVLRRPSLVRSKIARIESPKSQIVGAMSFNDANCA